VNTDNDIYPRTPLKRLRRDFTKEELSTSFDKSLVTAVVGMNVSYIHKALGEKTGTITLQQVLGLLDLDSFSETFIPRSGIPAFLLRHVETASDPIALPTDTVPLLLEGDSLALIRRLPRQSIASVITSTPYWATRIYKEAKKTGWADGENCIYGHEQTPEGFIRHSCELLYALGRVLADDGSIWWNLMDTFNTRTQIRSNAAETLYAMQGNDARGWKDHDMRRYSAGHSFLKDGEQCLIPSRVAERASRMGFYIKSIITWKKGQSMPETVNSRVTRELEYILHLSKIRTPYIDKESFLKLPLELGGRNVALESQKLTDVWCFSTASGKDGHGAQFPTALPARCISASTRIGDCVLDPFVGSGTTSLAARMMSRRSIGFDISPQYLEVARHRSFRSAPRRRAQSDDNLLIKL